MSGRVIVDGEEAGDPLVYASNRRVAEVAPVRRALRRRRRVHAARPAPARCGRARSRRDRVSVPTRSTLTLGQLDHALGRATGAGQGRVDGSGAASPGSATCSSDEALWRAGDRSRARRRRASTPTSGERLHRAIRTTLRVLGRRGGSHTGDMPRDLDVPCPRDGGRRSQRAPRSAAARRTRARPPALNMALRREVGEGDSVRVMSSSPPSS